MTTQDSKIQKLLVTKIRDANVSADEFVRYWQRLRELSGAQVGVPETLLIEEYRSLQALFVSVRESHEQLRAMVEKALAPPWFLAIYIGMVETARGPLAQVRHNDSARLVGIAEDVDVDTLSCGDEVYLSENQNLVVHKAGTALLDHGSVACVQRLLDDGRLCIKECEAEYIVGATQALRQDPPAAGDQVRWFRPAMLATEKLKAADAASPFLMEDVSDTPAQKLGGMDRDRDRMIARVVKHVVFPDLADEYGVTRSNRSILMEGPPGCGKTKLARVLASALKKETGRPVRLAIVSGSALYDPYVGQTERNIAALFREPPGFAGTTVIFLDELDAIGRARGGAGNVHGDRFLGTLLAEMEGFDERRNVVVIAATNRAEMLDAALLERFAYRIKVNRPNRAAAREIFRIYLPPELPVRPNGEDRAQTVETMVETAVAQVYDENADNQVARLQFRDASIRMVLARDLASGRLIEQIALAARQRAFERHAAGGAPGMVLEDLHAAVAESIRRLGATLSVGNVHSHLTDLDPAQDVVRVSPVVRRVHPELYLHEAGQGA